MLRPVHLSNFLSLNQVCVMGEMRNAHRVNLLDDRLPIVEKPATIQVEELNEVGLGLRKRQIKRL
ncbi:hypothetical protein SAMN05421548_10784 [Paraburkholderia lycopersici]|uniref:Uncharacterized protein n=1 Tax=Paraburkholderia lycopersici TaxID=416944 RepID=A0A1G6M0Q8_9BURK|nr:hypothetical protein SAMN05421548_10784 [Paraburkholderia lycopersici]